MSAAPVTGSVADLAPWFARELNTFATASLLPGVAVGVIADGVTVWTGATGHADLDREVPMTADSICQIASVTKTFAATAIMQLRDAGKLALEDPVVAYVPELARASNPFGPIEQITVERLLRHTSGLMGEVPNGDPRDWTQLEQDEVIDSLGRVEVIVRPGTVFRYSNLGYRLVAELVRRVSGTRWPDYVGEHILHPLGMSSTGTSPSGEVAERMSKGYGPIGYTGRRYPIPSIPSRFSEGDGDLWSSVNDLLIWAGRQIAAHRPPADERVIADSTLVDMHRPTMVASNDWREARCLGWGSVRRDAEGGDLILVAHGGLLDGFNSHVCFDREHGLGVVAIANGLPRGSVGDLAWSFAVKAVAALRASPAPRSPVASLVAPPPPGPLARFLGRYHDVNDGDEARIEYLDGALACLSNDRSATTPMAPTDDPLVFRFVEDGVLDRYVTFWLDDRGVVDGVNIGGYPLTRLHLPAGRSDPQ